MKTLETFRMNDIVVGSRTALLYLTNIYANKSGITVNMASPKTLLLLFVAKTFHESSNSCCDPYNRTTEQPNNRTTTGGQPTDAVDDANPATPVSHQQSGTRWKDFILLEF